MNTIIDNLKESYNELINHVTWPTWAELFETSRIVVIATIIFAALIGIMNFASNSVLKMLYGL